MKTLRQLLAELGIAYDLPDGVHEANDPRLSDAQLGEIHGLMEARFAELRNPAEGAPSIPALTAIREAQDHLAGAAHVRIVAHEQAIADQAALDALDARGQQAATPPAGADAAASTTDRAPGDAPTQIVGLGVTTSDAPPVTEQLPTQLAQVAGLQDPAHQTPAAGLAPLRTSFRAGAGRPGAIGEAIEIESTGPTLMELARTMHEANYNPSQPLKSVVASIPAFVSMPGVDETTLLSGHNTPQRNTEIIHEVLAAHGARLAAAKSALLGRSTDVAVPARTAAAPWCEPFETIRELPICVTTDTPVRSSIPFVPMGYGGFQFNQAPTLSQLWAAVDIWTAADQANVDPTDPDTWKRCMQLTCPDTLPVVTLDDWLTACVEWQVGIDLNNPERFRAFFQLLEGVRARLSEQYTLAIIDVLTKNYHNDSGTGAQYRVLGGVPDLVAALLAMFQGSTYDNRSTGRSGYTLYIDTDMMETLIVSEMRAAHAKTDGTPAGIIRYILEKVEPIQAVVQVKDRIPNAYGTVEANGNPKAAAAFPADNQAAIAVPSLVTAGRLRVVPTAEAFFFGTGEIRTGVKQDYSMARQNRVGWFAEEAFAGTKFGCQPWFALNATINANGYYVGAINRNIDAFAEPFATSYVADNATADEPDPNP